jgi:exodeoxyribonuclease-3
MMKLMTYNILDGGEGRLQLIVDAIKKEHPDYLTITEANTFANKNSKILKEISGKIGLPYFDIALSGEYNYHVAVVSKYPFKEVHKIQPLMRACLVTLVETNFGFLSIASLHLTPYSEDLRRPEIELIVNFQKKYENRILMGDMNSLSKHDGYNQELIRKFNKVQLKKFTTDGHFRFDVIEKILAAGYYDTALQLGKNKTYTVPTPANMDNAHANMRLDYIFISSSLLLYLNDYDVIKNDITDKASDHYPVIVNLH